MEDDDRPASAAPSAKRAAKPSMSPDIVGLTLEDQTVDKAKREERGEKYAEWLKPREV